MTYFEQLGAWLLNDIKGSGPQPLFCDEVT